MPLELKSIKRADDGKHKYVATFIRDGREFTTRFGAVGMSDYTIHHDPERRARYLNRHKGNEDWNEPTSAGSLSRHLLWGPSTSFSENLRLYKRRFGL
jgi:hypothetical protein